MRDSLNYQIYIEHSKGLKYAADENLNLFLLKKKNKRNTSELVGLLNSTMLLYAVSIELILKARALFEERDKIKRGDILNYSDFLKEWQGHRDGHNYFKIIDKYNLEISEKHNKILNELLSFTSWAGRFPFPKKEDETVRLEEGNGERGKLNQRYKNDIEFFISTQISLMQ